MALRYLAGKLRVLAGAALRRAEGSRGVASSSPQLGSAKEEVTSQLWTKEELQRITHDNEAISRRITEARLSRERYEPSYVSGGALLGFFIGVLIMLRDENYTGGNIRKTLFGARRD